MQSIYGVKFAESELREYSNVAICSMPLIAISAAKCIWSQDNRHVILLTPNEKSGWYEIYSLHESSIQWYSCYRWSIDDSPKQQSLVGTCWDENDLPDKTSLWLLVVEAFHGLLLTVGHEELWPWNERDATFIKNDYMWIS